MLRFPDWPAFTKSRKPPLSLNESWCFNRDAESRFLDFAKDLQYPTVPLDPRLSEKEEESKPYRYVRKFSEEHKTQTISEMGKEEIQTYVNRLLGAKGLDGPINEGTSD